MSEKYEWEIEQIKQDNKRRDKKLDSHSKQLTSLQSFKDKTVEQLIAIFRSIEKIEEDSRWQKRTLITTLTGLIITVLGSVIVWLIQS